jgi:hydroxymethylbilane synthase
LQNPIKIGTRESDLALWQARYMARCIEKAHPDLKVMLVPMTTRGDQIQDRPLADIGGKGLFIKELESALLDGRVNLAVHSLKDVPAVLPPQLMLSAFTEREDPRDAVISPHYKTLKNLPRSAKVGTSSLRRSAQLLHIRPDLQIIPLRGNVTTRLNHADDGTCDAVILAAAGLKRLKLEHRITEYLPVSLCIPAAGQGIMAVETRAGDAELSQILQFLKNPEIEACVAAERSFLAEVGGDCRVPAGIHASVCKGGNINAEAVIASIDGRRLYRTSGTCMAGQALHLGYSLAEQLLSEGGAAVLSELNLTKTPEEKI